MPWWNSNTEQQNTGALNLGLPNGQQQVPQMGTMSAAGGYNSYANQQGYAGGYNPYAPPPTEMDILSAMITGNPLIDKWLSDNNGANMTMLINLLSSIVAVSVHQILSKVVIKETDGGLAFDFSGVQGLPTGDSITMTSTQILNQASNNVQQTNMQFQQMVTIANQSTMQGMLDSALADPGLVQSVGGGIGSFMRGMAGGR